MKHTNLKFLDEKLDMIGLDLKGFLFVIHIGGNLHGKTILTCDQPIKMSMINL